MTIYNEAKSFDILTFFVKLCFAIIWINYLFLKDDKIMKASFGLFVGLNSIGRCFFFKYFWFFFSKWSTGLILHRIYFILLPNYRQIFLYVQMRLNERISNIQW